MVVTNELKLGLLSSIWRHSTNVSGLVVLEITNLEVAYSFMIYPVN
jgi:hypothetical protein